MFFSAVTVSITNDNCYTVEKCRYHRKKTGSVICCNINILQHKCHQTTSLAEVTSVKGEIIFVKCTRYYTQLFVILRIKSF